MNYQEWERRKEQEEREDGYNASARVLATGVGGASMGLLLIILTVWDIRVDPPAGWGDFVMLAIGVLVLCWGSLLASVAIEDMCASKEEGDE
jgi:hypothetical protein